MIDDAHDDYRLVRPDVQDNADARMVLQQCGGLVPGCRLVLEYVLEHPPNEIMVGGYVGVNVVSCRGNQFVGQAYWAADDISCLPGGFIESNLDYVARIDSAYPLDSTSS